MDTDLELLSDHSVIDWAELAALLGATGLLGKQTPDFVERVFRKSYTATYAFRKGKLVGTGRAISDGVKSSALYDIAVLPEFQRQGIGTRIVEDLLSKLPSNSVLLVSSPGLCGFYKRLGFGILKTAMLKHRNPQYWIRNGYMA